MCLASGVMEYAIGATHVTNGPALVSSVMGDTPLYHASRSLWENITDGGRARTPPSSSAPPPSHRFGHAFHSCLCPDKLYLVIQFLHLIHRAS